MARQADPNRIGVFRLGHLGDTVIALPAMWTVRQRYPEAEITLVTAIQRPDIRVQTYEVLPPGSVYDKLAAFPNRVTGGGPFSTLGRLRELRKRKLDAIVYLPPRRNARQIRRDRLFFQMAGAKQFFGFNSLALHVPDQRVDGRLAEVQKESEALLSRINSDGLQLENDTRPRADMGLNREELGGKKVACFKRPGP